MIFNTMIAPQMENDAMRGTIPTGTDLNDVLEPGAYNLDSGNSYTNAPDSSGIMIVAKAVPDATRLKQIFSSLNGDWIRFKDGNSWSSWVNKEMVKVSGTISSNSTVLSKAQIKSTMEVIGCLLGTPYAITSGISWVTANGSITLTTTISTSTTIVLYLSDCS